MDLLKEAEEAAGKGHIKTLYSITKVVCNDEAKPCGAIKDKNGKLLTSENERLERWKQHFQLTLNREPPESPIIIAQEDIQPTLNDIRQDPLTKDEIKIAMKHMENNKAAGRDNITVELLKADTETTVRELEHLFKLIWKNEIMPKEWKQSLIIKIPKKGDTTQCDNYRGISLLSVPSKIFARAIINRLYDEVNIKLRQEQAGFRRGRNTTEQIFTLRNIIEQSIEWQSSLYINFVNFEKAFDSVHQESLWKIMKAYGIPQKIINMVRLLYEDVECAVMDEGKESTWFKVKTGVKQGCVLSGFFVSTGDRLDNERSNK